MIKRLLIILCLGFSLGSFAVPFSAQAQITEIECSKSGRTGRNTSGITEPTVNGAVRGLIRNAFTYAGLNERLRCDPLIVGKLDDTGKPTGASVYRFSQTLVNFAVLIILIIIAFSNILRIKLDTYAVKKSVPLLIFGVIMANLGLPIIRTIVDFSGVLSATFIGETSVAGTRTEFAEQLIKTVFDGGVSTINNIISSMNQTGGGFSPFISWGDILAIFGIGGFVTLALTPFLVSLLLLAMAILFLPSILFFFLGLLFLARIYVIVLLAAVSPIAFASLGFQPLKGKIWGWWWQKFISWTFLAPATFAMMWLSVQFFRLSGGEMDIGTYIVTIILMGMALNMPFKMGGDWMTKWSKAVAEPVKNLLSSPITGTQSYLKKAIPRDVSRSLSARGLNFAKPIKAVADEWERRAAERESTSASVELGRKLSRLRPERTNRGIIRGMFTPPRLSGLTGKYERSDDFVAAESQSEQLVNNFGTNATYHTMSRSERDELKRMTQDALRSGDANRMIGAYLANVRLGNYMDDAEQEAILTALEQQNVRRENVTLRYGRIARERHGYTAASPAKQEDSEEAKAYYLNYLNEELGYISDRDFQNDTAQDMLNKLTDPETHNPLPIETIENNTTLFGIAHALLQSDKVKDRLTQTQKSSAVMNALRSNKKRLGVAAPEDILDAAIADRILPDPTKFADLEPLFVPGKVTGQSWVGLTDDQRDAIMQALTKKTRTFKKALERSALDIVNRELDDVNASPIQRANILRLVRSSIDADNPTKPPEPLSAAALLQATENDPRLAKTLLGELRPLNAALGNMRAFGEEYKAKRITQ